MSSATFYGRLSAVDDFADVADPQHYTPVPDDWAVAVGDVRDSTGAIEDGQYKEVNVVGASLIVATLNAIGHRAVPYAFAGDGATICVPGAQAKAVRRALAGTRAMADERFGLRLDVGLVPVADLVRQGAPVLVARYRLSDAMEHAVFMGGGLRIAEEQVKANPDGPYGIPDRESGAADFSGLECRWNQVPSRKDEIVALLVRAVGSSVDERASVYDEVIDTLTRLYGEDESRPVHHGQLRMAFAPRTLSAEQRVRTYGEGLLGRLLYWPKLWCQNLLGTVLMATDWTTSETHWGRYKRDLVAHTDHRKMDGTLRQVIAGTTAQRNRLESYLRAQYEQGRLVYGLDASEAVMVTCLVFQYEKEHVHFVDGADGGYAHAARALKKREEACSE